MTMDTGAFFELCRAGSTGEVLQAVRNGADVGARDEDGNTALIFAASDRPRLGTIRALVNNGPAVNARNSGGFTALMYAAARTARPEVVTLLLNAGAEVDMALANGWTALTFAAAANPDPEVVRALCHGGALVNARTEDGTTALMVAAERNPNVDVVNELIRHGADVNAKDNCGRTALTGAALRNSTLVSDPDPNPEIIDALLDNGADADAVWDGDRAIDIVKNSPYLLGTDTLERLRSRGPQWNREALLGDFLASLDVSPSSAAIYRKKLRYFFAWLDEQRIGRPGREQLLAWRDELMSSGRQPVTVAGYLTIVRRFFRWAHQKGVCGDIAEDIQPPRARPGFRDDTLTPEQVQRMLEGVDRQGLAGLRNYALLSLLVTCGLGYADASRAKMADLRLSAGGAELTVGRADGTSVNVKIPAPVVGALRAYWAARGPVKPDAPLFMGTGPHWRSRLPVRAIGQIVRDAARRAGCGDALLTPNSLRHTAVRLAAQMGGRIEDVQQFARHRCIETTYRYGETARRRHTCGETIASAIF